MTDGFTGNVALKTAEGTAKLFGEFLRAAFQHSLLGAHRLSVRPPARCSKLRDAARSAPLQRRDVPRPATASRSRATAATDALGFANAIGVAVDMKVNGFLDKIRDELARLNAAGAAPASRQAAAL